MKLGELREIILNHTHQVEVHENEFKILTEFIKVNDIFSLNHIDTITIVSDGEVWFNNDFHINLEDLTHLWIFSVEREVD